LKEEEGLVGASSHESDGEGEVEERVVELEGGREGGREGDGRLREEKSTARKVSEEGREEGVRWASLTKRMVRGRWRREL